ncbi:MAG: 6-phosphogluconolactonase [Paracoccus sp. (in: a-proteobacteria)]|nr:6-phosphogluconolactonase [Paracoccus sp. (in: a-proteobacteria)]
MKADIVTYPDRELLALSLADRIAQELRQHLASHGRASLCVPGGSSPVPLFESLAALDLDWENVTVFLNDERWVPRSNPRSNSAMLRAHLLQGPAAAAQYLDLYTGAETPAEAAPALTEALADHLPITVLILGMGKDLHTASLFPGAPGIEQLLAADAPAVMQAAGGSEPRITLTCPALKSALFGHLVIMGAEKREALENARGDDPVEAPIAAFIGDLTVHYAD